MSVKVSSSKQLHICICNERFLPRFGVDRILVLLAEHLQAQGHRVSFACLRYDVEVLRRITTEIYVIDPPEDREFVAIDEYASEFMIPLLKSEAIDVVVTGGWPFFS
jgi:hypothetical protein